MPLTLEELKELLENRTDEQEFLDLLGLDIHDLVEAFSDRIAENFDRLEADFVEEEEND